MKQSVLNDPVQRRAFEVQISEFGQTPKQIFFKKHPQKFSDVFKPSTEVVKPLPKPEPIEEVKEVYKPKEREIDLTVQRTASNSDESPLRKGAF